MELSPIVVQQLLQISLNQCCVNICTHAVKAFIVDAVLRDWPAEINIFLVAIVFMCLVMQMKAMPSSQARLSNGFSASSSLMPSRQTLSFRPVSCLRCQSRPGQVNSLPGGNSTVTVFGIQYKTSYIHLVITASGLLALLAESLAHLMSCKSIFKSV